MTRQLLLVVGVGLLSAAGLGLIVGVIWLVSSNVAGTPPYILEVRFSTLLYLLPALFLAVAIVGASFMARALSTKHKPHGTDAGLHLHPR